MIDMEYGLQLFSLRDISDQAQDLEGALRIASELGYRKIEFAGFFGHSAEEVKAMLDRYGLTACGTHTWGDEVRADKIDATIKYHQTIGCDKLIFPSFFNQDREESLEDIINVINEAQPKLAAAGITLGYHNHSAEFRTMPYGKVIFDQLRTRTKVAFELDTFWAFNADLDPVALMEELHAEGRLAVIHLKDGMHETADLRAQGKALGEGQAPVLKVLECARRLGVDVVVESEGLDPTGPLEVGRCMTFLKAQG